MPRVVQNFGGCARPAWTRHFAWSGGSSSWTVSIPGGCRPKDEAGEPDRIRGISSAWTGGANGAAGAWAIDRVPVTAWALARERPYTYSKSEQTMWRRQPAR